jgi:cytochrome c oxidase cbb3-type subunit 1
MWRTYTENGSLAYSFTDTVVAMHPYYIARAIGGLTFLTGTVVGAFNIWMTIRQAAGKRDVHEQDIPLPAPAPARLQPAE